MSKELLESYLGNEACWVRIDVKGRTLYKEYDPSAHHFNLPEDIGKDSEEVEVTIVKIITYEFVRTALNEANAPFDITFRLGKYALIVDGEEVCDLTLKNDIHYDQGKYGPAVIFAIRDYEGKEHLIKLVYSESKEYLCKVKIGGSYRKVESTKYEDRWKRLVVTYFRKVGETTCDHEVLLEDPKLVLVEMTKKLKETLEKKGDDLILEGDIGEGYIKLRLNEIKKKLSALLGIPENELAIDGPYKRGPDYRVYCGEELIAIIEVKTTRIAKIYQEGECLDKAKEDLRGYLDSNYRNARLGIPIAIYLEANQSTP